MNNEWNDVYDVLDIQTSFEMFHIYFINNVSQ